MNDFYVYMYLRSNRSKNGEVGSPYYIGKGRAGRALSTNRHNPRPKDISNILFISRDMNEADAFQLEILLIHVHGRIDNGSGCLRNFTDGGEGQSGAIQSEESRRKRSEWMKAHPNRGNELCPKWPKGKPRTPEMNAKQRASWTEEKRKIISDRWKGISKPSPNEGVKMSEERKRAHSEVMKGKTPWNKGVLGTTQKVPWTEERKEQLRQRMKGNTLGTGVVHEWTEEQRANHSKVLKGRASPKGMLGKKHSEETRLKMAESQRKRVSS